MFYEIVVAPGYTPEGLEVLKGKSKALRILTPAVPAIVADRFHTIVQLTR
jgi:AICAR transformylase/IMP cyclohydrolase PurH